MACLHSLASSFSSLSILPSPSSSSFSSSINRLYFKIPIKPIPILTRSTSENQNDIDTAFYTANSNQVLPLDPPSPHDGYVLRPSFDGLPPETEDEIAAGYEEIYGPSYSGYSVLGNDIYVMDSKMKKSASGLGWKKREKVSDGFEERVVQVRRVTKVVKGGKKMSFRAIAVVGDKKSKVGVGVGKAKEVVDAIAKSATNARRNIIAAPLTKYSTFPHRLRQLGSLSCGATLWLSFIQDAEAIDGLRTNMVYEVGELFELGIQLSYLLVLLGLLGIGSFFVIRQVLVRRELDLSAKELQEQVRSGEGNATELFELGAVMLRRKFYPAAIKYLQQAIEKWDRDDQDLAQVYNALGVSYIRDNKLEKGIKQFEMAVKIQPGYVTAWNNLGDANEKRKDLRAALKAFEEALLFDPNNKIARPRRDALRGRVQLYKGVSIKSEER